MKRKETLLSLWEKTSCKLKSLTPLPLSSKEDRKGECQSTLHLPPRTTTTRTLKKEVFSSAREWKNRREGGEEKGGGEKQLFYSE